MSHPLTDDKCYELWSGNPYENERMRAAADWQLEQVVAYLENDFEFVHLSESYLDAGDLISESLKKAMRPTTQEDLEDVQLALERMNSVRKPITLEELMTLDDTTQEDN